MAGQHRYPAHVRAIAACLHLHGERTVPEVAKDFNVSEDTIRRWVREERDRQQGAASAHPLHGDDRPDTARLRQENHDPPFVVTLRVECWATGATAGNRSAMTAEVGYRLTPVPRWVPQGC